MHEVEPLGGVGRVAPRGHREERAGAPRLDPHGPELQRTPDRLGREGQRLLGSGGVLETVPQARQRRYGSVRSPCSRRSTVRWTRSRRGPKATATTAVAMTDTPSSTGCPAAAEAGDDRDVDPTDEDRERAVDQGTVDEDLDVEQAVPEHGPADRHRHRREADDGEVERRLVQRAGRQRGGGQPQRRHREGTGDQAQLVALDARGLAAAHDQPDDGGHQDDRHDQAGDAADRLEHTAGAVDAERVRDR